MLHPDLTKLPKVFEGSNFIILDVSDVLPKHANFPHASTAKWPGSDKFYVKQGRGYYDVPGRKISHIIAHQTEGGYEDAWTQLIATASFFVREPGFKQVKDRKTGKLVWGWDGRGRGWPGFAYTWLVPYTPFVVDDKWVIWQCNKLTRVTWHTGDGMNECGGGIAFQGYFLGPDTPTPLKGHDGRPSQAQLDIYLPFWMEYAMPALGSSVLTMHCEHGKPGCPGYDLEESTRLIRGY